MDSFYSCARYGYGMSGGSGEEAQSLAFGGQALIEGMMMRSGSHTVMCVRQPDSNLTV